MIPLPSLPRAAKGLAWLLAVLALLTGLYLLERHVEQRGYDRAEALYTAAINAQKAQAAQQLADLTAKARSTEEALQASSNVQNLKDAKNAKTLADLSVRLRSSTLRLRDPYAIPAQCGPGGASPGAQTATAPGVGADHTTQATGALSERFADVLRGAALEADQINAAYASCREYVDTINPQTTQP